MGVPRLHTLIIPLRAGAHWRFLVYRLAFGAPLHTVWGFLGIRKMRVPCPRLAYPVLENGNPQNIRFLSSCRCLAERAWPHRGFRRALTPV